MQLVIYNRAGVYTEANCKTKIQGYHAVAAVGYGTNDQGIDYWVKCSFLL